MIKSRKEPLFDESTDAIFLALPMPTYSAKTSCYPFWVCAGLLRNAAQVAWNHSPHPWPVLEIYADKLDEALRFAGTVSPKARAAARAEQKMIREMVEESQK